MQIFDELFSYEERNSTGRPPRKSRFVQNTTWYVNENYMGKIFSYPVISSSNKIPGLYRTKIFGLMKNFFLNRGTHKLFPSAADAIQIKDSGERLRAFFNTDDRRRYSLKVVCDSSRKKFIEITKGEISVRGHLTSLGTINVPKIIAGEQRGNAYILCEEMILGRRFNGRFDRALYKESVLPQLRDTYLAYGVKYVPVRDYLTFDINDEIDRLVDAIAGGEQFQIALRKVTGENAPAAVSLCHGGLRPCNLTVSNGKVYFLDWKLANEGFIITDLLRTAVKYPKLDYIMQDIRQVLMADFMKTGCGFEDLLTIGIALEMHRTPGSAPGLLRLWQRHVLLVSAT